VEQLISFAEDAESRRGSAWPFGHEQQDRRKRAARFLEQYARAMDEELVELATRP
jgi:hypothetical protein